MRIKERTLSTGLSELCRGGELPAGGGEFVEEGIKGK